MAAGRAVHVTSLPPAEVTLPELRFGRTFLEAWRVREEPAGASWRQTSYRSLAPAVVTLRDVVVVSSCGILLLDDRVIAETLPPDAAAHGARPSRMTSLRSTE